MELLQTVPALINARSTFGRRPEHANRLYSRFFTAALNFTQTCGGDGPAWRTAVRPHGGDTLLSVGWGAGGNFRPVPSWKTRSVLCVRPIPSLPIRYEITTFCVLGGCARST